MQICITQREGIRYFSRFRNIPERDRLEVELTIEGAHERVFTFDLTEVLLERFAEHPEILGKRKIRDDDQLPALSVKENNRRKSVEAIAEPPKRTRVRRAQLADDAKVMPKPVETQPVKKSEPLAEAKPVKKARSVKPADEKVVKPAVKSKSMSVKPKEEPKTAVKKASGKTKTETSAKTTVKADKKVAAVIKTTGKKVKEPIVESKSKQKATAVPKTRAAKPVQPKATSKTASASVKAKVPAKPKSKTAGVK